MDGVLEAEATYPVILDTTISPPIIVCPFWGVEEYSRSEWRERLRVGFDAAIDEVTKSIAPPNLKGEWGAASWKYALWLGDEVVVALEETNYEEARVPFLVIACTPRSAWAEDQHRGLTARLFSGPDDAD
jgi:hypothetical protein